tara:strand:+ start:1078 stop:1197 length:120 start_codon:yes stop_codon:yes gene_type:complete
VHNDEYEDEEEEALFKQRAAKWEARRQARLAKAKEMKWD